MYAQRRCNRVTVKVGFHYPSSRPEFTGRVDGPWPVNSGAFFDTRQLGPLTRVVETGRPCTRAVYTGVTVGERSLIKRLWTRQRHSVILVSAVRQNVVVARYFFTSVLTASTRRSLIQSPPITRCLPLWFSYARCRCHRSR